MLKLLIFLTRRHVVRKDLTGSQTHREKLVSVAEGASLALMESNA
jgi:hypothetical protein